LQKKIKILPEETYGELEARLSKIGAKLLLETVNRLEELTPVPQSNSIATYAPKISKELRKINWQDGAKKIVNLIRALSPKPTAYTFFRGKRIEILKASVINMDGEPGKIVESKKRLIIGTGDKCIELKIVKPEAKREQTGVDFINGYKPQIGESMGGEDERKNRN
jgi:methionyl-tRNA formyltransferase